MKINTCDSLTCNMGNEIGLRVDPSALMDVPNDEVGNLGYHHRPASLLRAKNDPSSELYMVNFI